METVVEKFLRYVKVDTQSSVESGTFPSTEKQKNLGSMLYQELKEMGADSVFYDEERCYVYAKIPGNKEETKTIGFIAHMDTAPVISGKDVKPRIVENYDGGDILLNKEENIVLEVRTYPELKAYVGQSLIVTDGTTLLGADDKAGVAEIMAMAQTLLAHPEIKHGPVAIAFTSDEEIGTGMDHFDTERFGADYAYTVDGGALGEIEYENFNAASAEVLVHGVSVHPGEAKNKMKNAFLIAMEFNGLLPKEQRPDCTEGYEGFFHLEEMGGTIEEAKLSYIIRDHDRGKFEEKKRRIAQAAGQINGQYGAHTVELTIEDTYYNMREKIEPDFMFLVENAKKHLEELSVTPKVCPIRGGTDGARLSFMGIPCPNLCTGGHNFHGRFEYCCVESMEKVTQLLVKLAEGE